MHIGKKVVCVEGYLSADGTPLVEGEIYTIKAVGACSCELVVSVGIVVKGFTQCEDCEKVLGSVGEWWHRASRFADLEEKTEHDEAVEELLEELELQI